MSIETYSIADDFSGNLKASQFHSEIEANSSISTELSGLIIDLGNVDVKFASTITSDEGNVLDILVSGHIPDYSVPRTNSTPIYPTITSFDQKEWIRLGMGQFSGSKNVGNIHYIDVLTGMQSTVTDYNIKVIDRNNPTNKLCEATLNNTTLSINSLGAISNIPQYSNTLEV